jgi:hypothetical protein
MSDDSRKPIETPFDKTVPDLEQEVDPDGLGEERLKEEVAIEREEEKNEHYDEG